MAVPCLILRARLSVTVAVANMTTVKAKFRVNSVTTHAYGSQLMQTVTLTPVMRDSDPNSENSQFWAASPNGEIKLGTINLEAAKHFTINRECYVDFTFVDS